MKTGIFGGTFNPIHYGHLRAAEEITQNFLEKVIFVPTNITSNKGKVPSNPKNRLEMINIAINGRKKFAVSDIEIKRGGISYSYDTIIQFNKLYPNDDLYFIIGMDSYFDLKNWKNGELLFDMINFIVINRNNIKFNPKELIKLTSFLPDGIKDQINIDHENKRFITSKNKYVNFFKITRMDISSTIIRNNFKKNISNLYLLPKDVINYIINKKVYI
ncbi:MAG: nicotinate-nucleotide adenylyltransferase [Deltaproteobacteria bacterium]|jgi:nicotinate-nucleotide adenylyltransferase|nr:nicotinate-nucleotide adenylyltransferase [Deltaproteobacteria bacterium]MCL5879431.1 nicotinate-nucleotide adenylyltransferase [Deltaproteobacteria bacterium]MDA8304446.1 nicotinate-nucleotide adenylyltransferase [Deltaproteobacteria bacterium]